MITALETLLFAGALTALSGMFVVVFILAANPAVPRPELGNRGLKRYRALQAGGLFSAAEPVIRFVAGWLRELPVDKLRSRVNKEIVQAGDFLGMSANELLSMCILFSIGLGFLALVLCNMMHMSTTIALCAFALGLMLPWFRLTDAARRRGRKINLALPATVDLASLCMSAGMDFPGALAQIVNSAADRTAPIIEEFERVLQELELGYTRKRALEGFAHRVPTEQVREFVNSVVQAEEKGNPLSRVLTIQANTQRMRRSVAAEEMASKAAILLMGPMMMMFMCVIVLLLGPVIVRFMTGGFQ